MADDASPERTALLIGLLLANPVYTYDLSSITNGTYLVSSTFSFMYLRPSPSLTSLVVPTSTKIIEQRAEAASYKSTFLGFVGGKRDKKVKRRKIDVVSEKYDSVDVSHLLYPTRATLGKTRGEGRSNGYSKYNVSISYNSLGFSS